MDKLLERLEIIENNIEIAAKKVGRDRKEIRIVAASKTRSAADIKKLWETGRIAAFGENRVQEFLEKYDPAVTYDMIGRLQTNKVKYLIGKVRLIQSVDRMTLASEIDRLAKKAGIIQKILIEVNTGAEENKGGVKFEDVLPFAGELKQYENIELKGLMAVAPLDADERTLRALFLKTAALFEELKNRSSGIEYLSMGMSHDYMPAIECGANVIRPGRALFE
jgi:pyridoxal phosphate enzyme, YggS family